VVFDRKCSSSALDVGRPSPRMGLVRHEKFFIKYICFLLKYVYSAFVTNLPVLYVTVINAFLYIFINSSADFFRAFLIIAFGQIWLFVVYS